LNEPVEIELRLRAGTGGGYTAEMRMRSQDDAEHHFGPFAVQVPLAVLRMLVEDDDAYSRELTRLLFDTPGLAGAFADARARVKARSAMRLRLWIDADAPELHGVRWELLRERDKDYPLTSNENIYFSRYYPPPPGSQPGPKPSKGLRALAAVGAPLGLEPYKLKPVVAADELRYARAALDGITVDCLPGDDQERCTLARLVERLRDGPGKHGYDVLYLACHGMYVDRDKEPYLLLEDGSGGVERASGRVLAEQINGLANRPRLVVLASCESAGSGAGEALTALGPLLIRAGVPAVIAMQGLVRTDTAAEFIRVFFKELNRHGQIDRAAASARAAVRGNPDWWVPVLYMYLTSGRLWKGRKPAVLRKPVVLSVVPHQIPAARAHFTGRSAELSRLSGWVEQGERAINIYGFDGMGKTTLALELINRIQARFPGGILYLDMQGQGDRPPVPLVEALAHVIQSYNPGATLVRDPGRLAEQYQQILTGKRALILLDNVGDESQIETLVPPPEGSLALITSWRGMVGLDRAQRLALGKMSRDDAAAMLLRMAPSAGENAALLVEKCDFLPQAIASVAQLLKTPNLSADEIIDLLENAASELGQDRVDAALKVSYDMLVEAQQQNWRRLAVFAGDFSAEGAAWVFGLIKPETPRERRRTQSNLAQWRLSDLLNFGLVEFERERDRYNLLNLSRLYAAGLMSAEEQNAARLAHARHFLGVLEQANSMYLEGGSQMNAGLALYDREEREMRAAWGWLNQAGSSAERTALRARYPAAFIDLMALRMAPVEGLEWLEAGLAAARALGESGLEGSMLGGQGSMHYARHDYDQALVSYQAEMGLARQAKDCAGLVSAVGNLGAVYRAKGYAQRGLRYFHKQLELARRVGTRRQEAAALGNLGRGYTALKDLEQALAYYQQDLELSREIGDRRGEAIVLGGMGNVYRMQQKYARAREVLEQDLAISREIGDQHGTAIASWLLGLVYADEGDPARAAEWMQVLADYERSIDEASARKRSARVEALRRKG
jgi:tetratricopeptide (TPR) repeat protein